MDEDLEQELERLTAELSVAEVEAIRLQARIQGLRAQRDALAAALAARRSEQSTPDAYTPVRLDAIKKRTNAIEVVLRQVGRPLSIDEVREALDEAWREPSTYAVVASTLNLLHRTGRISKIGRGRYVAA
jgi:hypothetical protein